MARRMYDLGSGTEDIVVKDVKIVGTNGLEIIKDNDNQNNYKVSIISTNYGFEVNVDDNTILSFDDLRGFIFNTKLRLNNYPTASRPPLTEAGAGTVIYDSTLKKCILWNGTDWVNLDGTSLGA